MHLKSYQSGIRVAMDLPGLWWDQSGIIQEIELNTCFSMDSVISFVLFTLRTPDAQKKKKKDKGNLEEISELKLLYLK